MVQTAPTQGISASGSSKAPLGPSTRELRCSVGALPWNTGMAWRSARSARRPIDVEVIFSGSNRSSWAISRYERPAGSVRRTISPSRAWWAIGE